MAEPNSIADPYPPHVSRRIERERRRLNKAAAVLAATVLAVEHGIHSDLVADCVRVGRELIDAAIRALDSVHLRRPPAGDGTDV